VTSPGTEDGKSFAVANLAVVAAQMGQQVILLDCDLRQPQQHLLFNLGNDRGVATQSTTPQAVPEVPGLRVLTSGPLPQSPSQVLASRRFEELVAELAGQADLLLFDSPPLLAVSDAAVLATRVDGVLLVLRAGHTKRDEARRAKDQLEKVNAYIVGSLLTNVSADVALKGY
jgi:non-specific protein-tyrosine kinase